MDIHIVIAAMVMVITVKQIPYNTTQAKQNAIKILVMSSTVMDLHIVIAVMVMVITVMVMVIVIVCNGHGHYSYGHGHCICL